VLGMVAVFFLLLIINLLGRNSSASGPRTTALLRQCPDTYLGSRRYIKLIQPEKHCFFRLAVVLATLRCPWAQN
jgi:hypothetical protein